MQRALSAHCSRGSVRRRWRWRWRGRQVEVGWKVSWHARALPRLQAFQYIGVCVAVPTPVDCVVRHAPERIIIEVWHEVCWCTPRNAVDLRVPSDVTEAIMLCVPFWTDTRVCAGAAHGRGHGRLAGIVPRVHRTLHTRVKAEEVLVLAGGARST